MNDANLPNANSSSIEREKKTVSIEIQFLLTYYLRSSVLSVHIASDVSCVRSQTVKIRG